MSRLIDLTGQKFGRLTVIALIEKASRGKGNRAKYRCRCDCGKIKPVSSSSVRTGNTKFCGCMKKEHFYGLITKHGLSNIRLYIIWKHIVQRWENKNVERYKDYGGRGISICDEWRKEPALFVKWALTNGYKENLSIDRIDVNGNYCPDNCGWVPLKKQAQNKRSNRLFTVKGDTHCLSEWAQISGIPYETLRSRLKAGMPFEQAICKEARHENSRVS
jgi:hypothetical protein